MDSDMAGEDIEKDIESLEQYKMQYLMVKMGLGSPASVNGDGIPTNRNTSNNSGKPFKRPALDIASFNGIISVGCSPGRTSEKGDKLHNLKHAVEKNSKADHVVVDIRPQPEITIKL
ncbi:hypothetical protein QAD02_014886 [Eretmocerus hayati]|uniref:Uncharacterized protein n=1 Tax=Eretmocerus hayati TaxID=131215 RepID=A0ACC2P920_9HYME|nr:hypothetical protein QAD02_014886 [Eretmocerus hayati]